MEMLNKFKLHDKVFVSNLDLNMKKNSVVSVIIKVSSVK